MTAVQVVLGRRRFYQMGGTMHAFQIWLISRLAQYSPPRYRHVIGQDTSGHLARGGGWVKVIAGSFQTLEGPIQAGSKLIPRHSS